MFKTLLEAIDPEFMRLTDIQKAVLLTIFVAETPGVAFEASSGDIYITYARDYLRRAGLVEVSSSAAKVTTVGYEVLLSNGLVQPDSDELTDTGTEIMAWFEQEKRQLQESKIPFKTLKKLS